MSTFTLHAINNIHFFTELIYVEEEGKAMFGQAVNQFTKKPELGLFTTLLTDYFPLLFPPASLPLPFPVLP